VLLFRAGAAAEHVAQITGLDAQSLHVVSEDGSPRGEKLFVLWNPPLKPYRGKFWRFAGKKKKQEREDGGSSSEREAPAMVSGKRSAAEAAAAAATEGGRGGVTGKANMIQVEQEEGEHEDEDVPKRFSSISEVAYLLAELVRHDIRTIAFCTTRKLSELVLQYAMESLSNSGHARLCGSIKSYRGGYTPEQRRSIEAELFGDILRVSSLQQNFAPKAPQGCNTTMSIFGDEYMHAAIILQHHAKHCPCRFTVDLHFGFATRVTDSSHNSRFEYSVISRMVSVRNAMLMFPRNPGCGGHQCTGAWRGCWEHGRHATPWVPTQRCELVAAGGSRRKAGWHLAVHLRSLGFSS
jgi:hypothetical protein